MLRKKNIVLNDKKAKGDEILSNGDSVKLYLSTEGYSFPHGSTGFAAIGDGYFYVSHHGRADDCSLTNVKLYRYDNEDFTLME